MLLFLHLIVVLTSTNTNNEINFYITLSNNLDPYHVETEFKIIIYDIFVNNYGNIHNLLVDILENVMNIDDVCTIISDAISGSFLNYIEILEDREKTNFNLFLDILIPMLFKKEGVFRENLINYVKDLEDKFSKNPDHSEAYKYGLIHLTKIIKNISMLVDTKLQLLFIEIYRIEQNYNRKFINGNTRTEKISLQTLLNDYNFIPVQLISLSEKEIEDMIMAIIDYIKDIEININIYLDMRLENFFVDYFDSIFKKIDDVIKNRSSKRIKKFTHESFIQLQEEMNEEIKKILRLSNQEWDKLIFGSGKLLKYKEEKLTNKVCYYQLNKNTDLLNKLLINYGIKQGFNNEETTFNISQKLNAYDQLIHSKLVSLLKQRINEKYKEIEDDSEIDITKLYNNLTNLKHINDRDLNPIKEEDELIN